MHEILKRREKKQSRQMQQSAVTRRVGLYRYGHLSLLSGVQQHSGRLQLSKEATLEATTIVADTGTTGKGDVCAL